MIYSSILFIPTEAVTAVITACGIVIALFIIYTLISLWAMNKAIKRRPDIPLEILEKDENTAWYRFKDDIHRGIGWLSSMPRKTLTTVSHDGLTLYADLIEHEDPKATIIMFHGYRSTGPNDFSCATEFYYSLGFNLLIVDQRAHGRSEGKYIGFGALERFDCQKWSEVVYERYGKKLPIIITGISMGASTVLMASNLKLPKNLIAIIADCGFTSPSEIIGHVIRQTYHIPPYIILPAMSIWSKILAGYSFNQISTCETLKRNTIPVLFIHGEADDFVPCDMTRRAFDTCSSEKEAIYVEGAGHGESYIFEMERCQNTLKSFIEKQFEKFEKCSSKYIS